jgi:biotin operon repressor
MSQLSKVAKFLRRNNVGKGVTASMIAKATGVPRDSVLKRISDLRTEGKTIYSNMRKVNGARKIYYRIADTFKGRELPRVAKFLRENNEGAGVTASQIARATGVKRANVVKRISDLRNVEGKTIYSNMRIVKGAKKIFYRFAA